MRKDCLSLGEERVGIVEGGTHGGILVGILEVSAQLKLCA